MKKNRKEIKKTGETQSEQAIPSSDPLYQTVFSQSPDGILIIDTEGRIIAFNDAAHRSLGYSREEFAKLHMADIDRDDNHEDVRSRIKKIIASGNMEFEAKHRSKGGELRDVHVIVRSLLLTGRTVLHAVWHDVTDRKLIEAKLKESVRIAEEERARSQAIIQAIGEGISIRDLNYRLTYQNQIHKDILGDHVGEYCYRAFHGLDQICEDCPVALTFIDGQVHVQEVSTDSEKGTLYFENTASPVRDSSGAIIGGIELVRDITDRKRAEEELKESENRYHALFDQSPDGVVIIDTTGKILDFNEQAHARLGYTRDEFALLSLHDLDPFESPEEIQAHIERVQKAGKAVFEVRHRTKTGDIRDVQVITQVLMFSGRSVHHSIFRDVTESKRMELMLRQSEELLKEAARVSRIGVFDHDHGAQTIYWSPEQRMIYGWGPQEPVTLPAFLDLIHPEDRERISAEVRRAHDPSGDGRFDVEHRIIRRDGSLRWLSTRSQTFFEMEHDLRRPVRTIGATLDITERKQMEQSLRESEEKFRTLFESASDALFIFDFEGNILDVNAIAYGRLGYTKEELLSLHLSELDDPSFAAILPERMARMKQYGRITLESAHVRKDGSVMPVEINARTIHLDGKELIFSVIRDITDRKLAEEVLRRSHEELEILVKERTAELTMLNDQLRNLSVHLQNAREQERMTVARDIHDDLGQSMTAVTLELARLKKRLSDVDPSLMQQMEYVAKLVESAAQSVKRIATELRPGILDHIGLTSAIEWQAGEFEKRTGMPCTVVFEPEEIYLDRDRSTAVFRIFQESLTNVTRHAEASRVYATLRLEHGVLHLRVKDDGKGITEQQVSDSKSLGLIGMRERVHYWGGSFMVAGVQDKGTTVEVRIPLAK